MLRAFPGTGWRGRDREPASDLDLVVLLVNSLDYLADPADRLADLSWFRAVLAETGHGDQARALRDEDLAGLRELREALRAVFLAPSADQAVSILNPLLLRVPAVPQLVVSAGVARLTVNPGDRGLPALAARLPAALAA